ncbi:hypothetical protein PFLUV_G00038840 [Perca fluviatilis]|uniref:Uncharacterized protein n=1 Tax=Perca fluviatilis TaxID=8168 RepID=A0A6A5EPD2_PERFL|nr:hypothetical protein PFLUV_G00038840 [Perca fluviatilis]
MACAVNVPNTATRRPEPPCPYPLSLYKHSTLPLQFRIQFKAIYNLAPPYLSDLLQRPTPSHSLRSSSSIHLSVLSARLTTTGSRAFSRSAPHLIMAFITTPTQKH